MAKVLFHIDLNAFFAAAEEKRHPEYKGKPMAVGSLSARGVLATANYEARKLGIHSAMPTLQAKAMCRDLIVVECDPAYYRQLSSQFFALLKKFSSRLEPVSIDECFMDMTEAIKAYKRPLDLAVTIQQTVYDTLGLQCSIGVGPNRFLAKMASDMRKPMGITVLRRSEMPTKLWPLGIDKMIGIGTKTLPKLQEAGITTIGDLADPENENRILQMLHKTGYDLIQKARGQSSDVLAYSTTRKSVSVSRTYAADIYTLEELLAAISDLARELSGKMAAKNMEGRTVSLVLRDTRFKNQVRSLNLPAFTNVYASLYEACSNLATENFEPCGYRHVGISVGSLKGQSQIVDQPTIFEDAITTTADVIARLNKTMDASVFKKASDLLAEGKDDG